MPMKTIDAATLKQWLDRGEAILVDVREPAEHAAQRIAQASLVPVGEIGVARLPAAAAGRKLVIHCLKGGRGAAACEKLLQENPSLELYNLEGGIGAWAALGYPVTCG